MAAVTASLVGTSYPRATQVVVTGLTSGQSYEIRGTWSGKSWPVRAGTGVSDGSQVVRTDLHSPVNVPVVYEVLADGVVVATSSPVTVDYTGRYVIQSLDGKRSAAFRLLSDGLPREEQLRSHAFAIPGRATPVVVYDVSGGESGEWQAQTSGGDTDDLRALVRAGAPLVFRTDGTVRDLAPTEIVQVHGASHAATWVSLGGGTARDWSLSYRVLDDPEPNTLVATSTWDDFDAVYAVPDVLERTNLVTNPSFEAGITGWTAARATLVQDAAVGSAGTASAKVAVTDASAPQYIISVAAERVPVIGGGVYSVSADVRTSAGQSFRIQVYEYDSAGTLLTPVLDGPDVATVAGAFARVGATFTLRAAAASIRVLVFPSAALALDDVYHADAVLVEEASAIGAYFDGDTTDTATERYDWTGAAHASTSTLTKVSNTWDAFDAEWLGSTWDQFDVTDWATRAAT